MATTAGYVGIDVAKRHLDLALHATGQPWQVANDATGVKQVVKHLLTVAPTLIVLEATGGLETRVVSALAAAQLPVVVVNPRQVRAFAQATGTLAKTDRLYEPLQPGYLCAASSVSVASARLRSLLWTGDSDDPILDHYCRWPGTDHNLAAGSKSKNSLDGALIKEQGIE